MVLGLPGDSLRLAATVSLRGCFCTPEGLHALSKSLGVTYTDKFQIYEAVERLFV